jgi:hypothetical protein
MGWLEGCVWCVGEVVVKLWTVQVRWCGRPGDVEGEYITTLRIDLMVYSDVCLWCMVLWWQVLSWF